MAEWENGALVKNIDFKKYPLIKKWLTNPNFKKGSAIHIETRRPKEHLMQKAMLKTAYLHMFNLFGFEFSFSNTGRKIVDVIKNNGTHPMSNFGVFTLEDPTKDGLYRILSPAELLAFMLCFTIKIKNPDLSKTYCVIIPFFYPKSWDKLQAYIPYENNELPVLSLQRIDENFIKNKDFFSYSQLSISPGEIRL
jgi:hypothetical protein